MITIIICVFVARGSLSLIANIASLKKHFLLPLPFLYINIHVFLLIIVFIVFLLVLDGI